MQLYRLAQSEHTRVTTTQIKKQHSQPPESLVCLQSPLSLPLGFSLHTSHPLRFGFAPTFKGQHLELLLGSLLSSPHPQEVGAAAGGGLETRWVGRIGGSLRSIFPVPLASLAGRVGQCFALAAL